MERKKRLSPAALRLLTFSVPCLLGGGCDLSSKAWAVETLAELPAQTMSVVAPWLDLSLSYNRGTAFSFVTDLGELRWVLGALSLFVVFLLVFVATRAKSSPLESGGLGMVAGGAIGNGIDRMFNELPSGGTAVVDFIRVNYPWGGSWPTFNVADALVAVGVFVVLLSGLRKRDRMPPS
jgi:signal peptidase II